MAELINTTIFSDTNLKAYYRFSSGALTTDSTANTHTLSAIGSPAETTGKFGGGVDLSSSAAYSAVDGADFKPAGSFSVGAWVKTTSTDKMIFQSYSTNGGSIGGLYLYVTNVGTVQFASGRETGVSVGTDYQIINSSNTVNDGNWHLVVGVYNGATLKVYIDNNAANSVAWANNPGYNATNYVRVGCENDTGSNINFLTGQLDEVFILKGTAISTSQISELYTTGAGGASFLNNFV